MRTYCNDLKRYDTGHILYDVKERKKFVFKVRFLRFGPILQQPQQLGNTNFLRNPLYFVGKKPPKRVTAICGKHNSKYLQALNDH